MSELNEVPVDTLLNDLLAGGPFPEETFRIDDFPPMPEHPDIITISRQLESLSIENNTQSLQLKIERMKRRQLRSSLRSMEQMLSHPCPDATSLKQELIATQEHQNAINFQFEGDVTSLRAMMFRCLTRMHQMMNRMMSHMVLHPDDNYELTHMSQEIAQTFQHFQSYYTVSYV